MEVVLSMFGPTAHGESPRQVAAGLREAGATQLMFFTSLYHGYRLLQPRYPHKAIYTLESDRVFFQPDLDLYQDCSVKPQRSRDFPDLDWVEALADALHDEGLAFSPLVPICAGGGLAQERPDLAVQNLYGSRDRLFLCHNNPELRAYRMAMIRDIAGRYPIDNLMLDKIPQTQLEQSAFSGIFDPPLRTVGSFCFCEHCIRRGEELEFDLKAVRARALVIAQRSLKIPQHVIAAQGEKLIGDTEIPVLLLEEPLIYQMLQFRFQTAVELVSEIRALLKSVRPTARLQAAFVPPSHLGHDMTSPRSWLAIQSYQKYAGVLDEIFCVVHQGADVVRFETERAVAAAEGGVKIITSMSLYGATRPEEVAPLAEAALAGGSQGVSFLGYDVTSNELLLALRAWSDSRKG